MPTTTAQTGIPTRDQIRAVADGLAVALGGGVHVNGGDVALSVDVAYPGMSAQQFASIRPDCAKAAEAVRQAAMAEMWGEPV